MYHKNTVRKRQIEKEQGRVKVSRKEQRTRELIQVCLDVYVEKGLTITTTTHLSYAAGLQNGGIYYYFDTKEEIVIACAEAAIDRIEKRAFGLVLEDLDDIENMMNHLGAMADELSPVMRFLVSVCVSQEYGEKISQAGGQISGLYQADRKDTGMQHTRCGAVCTSVHTGDQQLYDIWREGTL